jgi:hypothetical protein
MDIRAGRIGLGSLEASALSATKTDVKKTARLSKDNVATPFDIRCEILSELWLNYKKDPEFEDFIQYNDLGLPLAYCISEGVVEATEIATKFINETFELLLAGLAIEDEDFENLDEMLGLGEAE